MNKFKKSLFLFLVIGLFFTDKLYATPYSFYIDSFKITGNLPVYFVDDFNGYVLTFPWFVYEPTVIESNGLLKLSSPGDIFFRSLNGVTVSIESTTVASELALVNGLGSSIATSTWLPYLPQKNQMFFMEAFHFLAPNVSESISIGISRFSPEIDQILAFPVTGNNKPIMFFGWENLSLGQVNFQAIPINPQDITGNIILEIMFNDATNQFSGAFSLNGGKSFETPFTPVSPLTFNPPFVWGMNAVSCTPVPEPGTILYFIESFLIFILYFRQIIR